MIQATTRITSCSTSASKNRMIHAAIVCLLVGSQAMSAPSSGLFFDGVDDYVTMGAATALNVDVPPATGFTVECWFRQEGAGVTTSTGSGGLTAVPLVAKGRAENDGSTVDCNFFLGIDAAGRLAADFESYAGGTRPDTTSYSAGQNFPVTGTNTAIVYNTWYHAAATYDNATYTWTLFLNGTQVGSATTAATAIPRYDSIQHFAIGSALNSTGAAAGFFNGRIDEVRIWNYPRSAAQIAAAKDSELAAASGLLGRYGLNDATGTTTANSVGVAGAPVGTLTNGPLWVDGYPFVTNTPPSVTLTAPADNTTANAPATLDVTATAGDADGSVAKVEFFAGATKLGEVTSAPYTYHWTAIPSGDYALTAKATDNLGATATSSAVTLHVSPPNTLPPVVSISSPADGATFTALATINLTATASDQDGTVAKVEFFNGATKLGEATAAPFSYAWTNVAAGDYTLTAKATDDMTATGTSAAVTVHVLPNQPPVVTMTAPADNATGIGSSTSLQLGITDTEGDAQTVTYYGRMTPPPTPGPDFAVVAIPDTQYYSENTARAKSTTGNPAIDTGAVAAIYNAQTQWCVDNRNTRNIVFVSHMGDIAQNGDTYQSEWQVADAAQKLVENPATTSRPHGLPWGVAPGNHDQQPIGDAGGTTNYFNQYFNFTRWDKRPYYGGHFGTKGGVPANTNNYELFSASGMDFIIIHMEYDVRAKSYYQPVLDWADALLKAYPSRRAIVTSHWILNTGNPAAFSTQGQDIYDALKNNPNLFLMLCGHVHGEGQRADTYLGHTVYSILTDYQEASNGGNGFLRVLTFKPATNQIHVESYSPTLNRAVDASDAIPSWTPAYDLSYNMQTAVTDWIPLGTAGVPAAGTSSSLTWTGLEAGKNCEWKATANDGSNLVTTATRRFSTALPAAPLVTLASPTDGASFGLNSTINLTATASDSDGSVARVEFFDGGTKLGEVISPPYTFAWLGATGGNHAITAVATDNSGLDSISAVANITVQNLPPSVALSEPDPGGIYDAPASVYFTANAADADGTVAKVEYFANGTKVGEATVAPYAFFWNNVYTGSYTLTAKATDNGGASTISAPLSISVTNTNNVAPAVAITTPAPGLIYVGNITITASASDTDGTVSKVEFFNGATKLGEALSAPYSYTWNNVAVGSYTLTAKATDNDGGVTTSAGVSINVQAVPVSFSENFDSMGTAGTSPPAGWSMWNANSGSNASWTDSIAIPGTGTTSVATMVAAATPLTVNDAPSTTNNNGYNAKGASSTDRVLATSPTSNAGTAIQWQVANTGTSTITSVRIGYDIRRYAAVGTANELPGYWLFYSLDNGTTWTNVSALNPTLSGSGVQVPNTVGVTTVAPTTFTLSGNWAPGATLKLRWVDDNAVATSPDQIIGLDNVTLTSAGAIVGTPPTVALTAPLAGATFTAPATINLAATASDTGGTVTKVEFFNGATKLSEALATPYTYAWTGVAAGSYSLTARATDNDGNVTTSSAVGITVNPAPGSGTLTRGAYLQQAGPTTMTVRWRSSQAIAGRVQYGAAPASLTSSASEGAAVTDHEVTLTGLTPNTTYYYNIGSAYDTLAGGDTAHKFTTPPTAGTTPNTRVWVLGDAGTGTSSQTSVRDAFYTWTGARDPNFVLQLGDNAYNSGLDSEFQSNVFNIYGSLMHRVPFWSCLGNHETNQATAYVDTYPYFSIYTFPKNGECGGVASGTEHYYSFDYGNVHFISLDSMTASRASNGAMATWVTNDLASTTATWIVAFFHHPPYTKGSHDSDTETELIEMRTNLLPILEAGGVDLVLCGHSHCYERSYLLDGHYGLSTTLTAAMKKNAGDGRVGGNGAYVKPLYGNRSHFGAVYTVAGSAGQTSGGSLNHPAHFISLNNLGSLVLDVSGTRLDATFLRETGVSNDTFTIVKQGGSTKPIGSTSAATSITATAATLNAAVNPTGTASTAKFQSGLTTGYGTDTTVTLSPNDGLVSQAASATLSGLAPGTTYHYRVSATNSWGTVTGADVVFTTLHNNASLSALTLSAGTLSPVFATNTTGYSAGVSNATASMTVTPTVADATAAMQVRVNGGAYSTVASGNASGALALNTGSNTIDVEVTAQDGSTVKTYTVGVTRPTPFEEWSTGKGLSGPNSTPAADYDGDGFINLLEWAFGTDPKVNDAGQMALTGAVLSKRGGPVVAAPGTFNGVDYRAVFCRRKDYVAAGIAYTVQFSADLAGWFASTDTPTVIADDSEIDAVAVPFPLSVGGNKPTFFRVFVSSAN